MSKLTSVIFAILVFITIIASFGFIIFGRIIGIAIAESGASVTVPAKYVPHFKAGKEMRLRVDGTPRVAETE